MKKVLVCIITFFILSFPIVVSANPFSLLLLGLKGVQALSKLDDNSETAVNDSVISGVKKYIMSGMKEIGHPLTFGSLYDAKKINDSMVLTYMGTIDGASKLFSIVLVNIKDPDKLAVTSNVTTWDSIAEYKSYTPQKLWKHYKERGIDIGPMPPVTPDETMVSNTTN